MAYDGAVASDGHGERDDAQSLRTAAVRLAALTIGIGIVAAIVGGLVWTVLANPPSVRLQADGGVVLGEVGLDQQAGVTLWFFLVGVVGGAVCGLLIGWLGARFGWGAVVAVLVCCGIAAWGSGLAGQHLFGPDPAAEVRQASTGALVTLAVHVDSWIAYLGWPIGGAAAVLAVVLGWPKEQTAPAQRDRSGTVVADM